jgi:hypothetical protein
MTGLIRQQPLQGLGSLQLLSPAFPLTLPVSVTVKTYVREEDPESEIILLS